MSALSVGLWTVLVATAAPAPAVTAADVAGRYRGAIETPGTPLAIDLAFEQKNGVLNGTIDITAQNIRGMALGAVKLTGDVLSFTLPGIPGDPTFTGTVLKTELRGNFTQGGQTLAWSVKRLRPADAVEPHLKDWDALVAAAIKDFNVAGVGMAVVKDGEVVLARGYGLRDVEKKLPVTGKTLFAIGSCTKAFTTATMARLSEEGRLDWDAPVQRYLPGFTLKDEYAASHLTPRDMVSHVSGLPRHDLSWYNNLTLTREEVVKRLAFLPPNKSFRQEWQYNNLMFMAAGHLVEKISGKSWEANVKERLFTPLGMTRSNFSVKDMAKDADHAEPYNERKDVLQKVPFRDITTAGPAGSINSSAEEMGRWVAMLLNGGTFNKTKVLSTTSVTDLFTPRAIIQSPPEDATVPLSAYASGWGVDAYRGHRRVHHSGGIDGFVTLVTLFPDDNLGVVVFINTIGSGSGLTNVLTKTLADRVLGLPQRDWMKEALEKRTRSKALEKESKANKAGARITGTNPSRAVEGFAGRYGNPGYGEVDITFKDGTLTAVYNGIRMPLEHWHYDVFRAAEQKEEPEFEGMLFTFRTSSAGDVDAVEVPMEPLTAPISFARGADPRLQDAAFLARLAGPYELMGKTLTVEVRGKTLFLVGSTGAATELVAQQGLSFQLKGISMVRLTFVLGQSGPASEIKISDPDGMVAAKRK